MVWGVLSVHQHMEEAKNTLDFHCINMSKIHWKYSFLETCYFLPEGLFYCVFFFGNLNTKSMIFELRLCLLTAHLPYTKNVQYTLTHYFPSKKYTFQLKYFWFMYQCKFSSKKIQEQILLWPPEDVAEQRLQSSWDS